MEIMNKIFENGRFSEEEREDLIDRYRVEADMKELWRSWMRRQIQRFVSKLKDDDGNRLAVAVKGRGYVLIDYCNDKKALHSIHESIQNQINGLTRTDGKVQTRLENVRRMVERLASQLGAEVPSEAAAKRKSSAKRRRKYKSESPEEDTK